MTKLARKRSCEIKLLIVLLTGKNQNNGDTKRNVVSVCLSQWDAATSHVTKLA